MFGKGFILETFPPEEQVELLVDTVSTISEILEPGVKKAKITHCSYMSLYKCTTQPQLVSR